MASGTPVDRCDAAAFWRAASYSRTFSDSAVDGDGPKPGANEDGVGEKGAGLRYGFGMVRVDADVGEDESYTLGGHLRV